MKKGIILFVVCVLIGLGFLFFKDKNESETDKNLTSSPILKSDSLYDDRLNEEVYKKVGINPEKYNTFKDFLKELKSFSGVLVDVEKEDFVIAKKEENGSITYVPFRQKELGVFDDKINKNLAILDIYTSYKNNSLFGGRNSRASSKIIFEKDVNHPETEELRQIFGRNLEIFKVIKELETVKTLGDSKKEFLSYLYDFTGKYSSGNLLRNDLCKKDSLYCEKNIELTLTGKTLDEKNNPISGSKIELLNDASIKTISKADGTFELKFKWYPFSHIRFKSSKNGYSDAFYTISLNSYLDETWNSNFQTDFFLNKANSNILLNTSNKKEYEKGGFYVFKTAQSTYFVPKDGIYYMTGENYKKDFLSVYLYEFTKTSNISNLANSDTFEPVYGYVGNLMKTFGMPYIQFFDESGQELFIKASNPIILQNKIYHMKELYDNYDKIYEALQKEDMTFLVNKSKELGGYPIDFNFLVTNNFLRWPAWWALDRKTGIWSNVGHKVVNEEGLVELSFYSINDLN